MQTPEEEGKKWAEYVFQQRLEQLAELNQYMLEKGMSQVEYVIIDNWDKVLESFDTGKPIAYKCSAVPKLTLNTLLEGENN